jgi:hypothetical protein
MASAQRSLLATSQSTALLISALRSANGVCCQPRRALLAASSTAWVWAAVA